jgi:hypothetical protein
MKTIVAFFDNFDSAQTAVHELVNNGFRREDISLVASDQENRFSGARTGADDATSGAAGGAGVGAVLGGLTGLLVGLGALAIPGIGPVIAAGPLAAALAGAGIGAVAGGLIGALVDAGIPEEEARYYAEGVRRGGTLVTLRASEDMVDRATAIMNRYNPVDINQRATQWQESGWTGFDSDLSTYTGTSTGDFSDYENDWRRDYERSYATSGYSYDQYAPAYRYGHDLSTNDRYHGREWNAMESDIRRDWEQRHPDNAWDNVKNAVQFGWQRAQGAFDRDRSQYGAGTTGSTYRGTQGPDTQRMSDDVRSGSTQGSGMRSDMDQPGTRYGGTSGGSGMQSAGSSYDYDTDFRSHFDTNYANRGYSFDRYQPAYRYGQTLASDQRYQGRRWDEFEMDARHDWERSHPDSAWDDVKDAIRHAWNRVTGKGDYR